MNAMLFMVIEHFNQGAVKDTYRRFKERGRMAPGGVRYVDSWIEAGFGRCFQLMECDDLTLLQDWVVQWSDLALRDRAGLAFEGRGCNDWKAFVILPRRRGV